MNAKHECAICGSHFDVDSRDMSRVTTFYGHSVGSLSQYLCPTCAENLRRFIDEAGRVIRKRKSRQLRVDRIKRKILRCIHE